MKKKYIPIILLTLLLVIAGACFFYLRRPKNGVEALPSAVYEPPSVVYYLQKDDRWKEDKLGQSVYTMGGSGCLTSCIASALSIQAEESSQHESFTPGELNRLFTEKQVYNASGDIVWGEIKNALPETTVEVKASVSTKQIDTWLENRIYPLARVKNNGNGPSHWVLIVGSDGDNYLCMDPLRPGNEPVPLSVHGNMVYSIRAVSWGAE
ncbi:hypothetical protein GPL15_04605 [Clostridium sp. MCC353]|uniref:hypothetical protein n=1 Tax=Clostridium sp. MCC353 TaxID=2592646 RepID=UPI001C00F8B9|nr:hypothetical protein [Clostridium sp. MCC353]MBT9775792.1 hypothetical protein [Clostridium sp. MCC353]